MKYLAMTKYIRNSALHHDFVSDMVYCERNEIPIIMETPAYQSDGTMKIVRADRKPFESGMPSWNHDIIDYPMTKPYKEIHFGEELFEL